MFARRLSVFIFGFLVAVSLFIGFGTLLVLVWSVLSEGLTRIDWQFLTSYPSRKPEQAGILSALVGSIYLIGLTMIIAVPVGIGAAIYLEEYAAKNRLTNLLEINIANLAGTPSIIYGLLGLELFVRGMMLERSLIAGAMTMALLILPVIIIAARESIRRVPGIIREASYALGATKWQTIRDNVLPIAFPGILTGVILGISRAIGETAPLITLGALTYVAFLPDNLKSPFTALPIQIFNWVSRPQKGFHVNAAAGIVVLLVGTLLLNALALYLRDYLQKKSSSRML
ncbi:MAG: phosphate ABC transporter, permease protein PstA [Candidatus Omnitrophica bacterium CG12_big_fil_rev_8_21_14_0_65_50_5]|nr:MAG: phosphate ABC transporter, permease protein PstA [Candidatus Omnitrophica bacterium CG12_big_fil_rev_8_21_14_0_65_50_5]